MLSSPAKRRRSNTSTAIPVNAPGSAQNPESNDIHSSRTKRASFQSPTKASLARSHPEVLSRVLSRYPPKSAKERPTSQRKIRPNSFERQRLTRNGVDGSKIPRPSHLGSIGFPARPSEVYTTKSGSPHRKSNVPAHVASPSREDSENSQVFQSAYPPRRSKENTASSQLNEQTQHPLAEPTTKANGIPSRFRFEGLENEESDLPPSPAEFGLGKAPDRLADPSSSSPSQRQEKKQKRRLEGGIRTSPTRYNDVLITQERDREEIPMGRRPIMREKISQEMGEKQKLHDKLATQLAQLKNDITLLENETRRQEKPDDYPPPDQDSIRTLMYVF